MAEENREVDLYDELDKILKSDKPSEEDKTEVPPDQKPTPEKTDEKKNDELSEEDVNKLPPKAQKRIRDLAEKVKELATKTPAEEPEKPSKPGEKPQEKEPEKPDPEFKSVEEFLSAVQDKDSRNLLEKFYKTIRHETSEILSPIEQSNNEKKFEQIFDQYKQIEGLEDYRDDLKKTFMRNPKQDPKSLISDIVLDLQKSKIKPSEKTPSSPNRGGEVNLDSLDKDQLYDKLESMRPPK